MSNLEEITGFLAHLADAIVVVDEDSNIAFANPACSRLFGYSEQHWHGMKIDRLMACSSSVDHHELVRAFIRSQPATKPMMSRAELPCVDASGNRFNARISLSAVTLDGQSFGVATIQDFSSLRKEIERLEIASHQDTLTGLFNRRYLEKLSESGSRIFRAWKSIGVVCADLDRFKPINDRYGHEVGDAVLKVVSNRIKSCVRFDDIVIRMGGDEFLVLVNLSDAEDRATCLAHIADKIRDTVVEPIETGHAVLTVGFSAGCGLYPDNDGDLTTLVSKADRAMYVAKDTGTHIEMVGAD